MTGMKVISGRVSAANCANLKGRRREVILALVEELITRDIIGAAMTVLNELGPGLDEKIYENALLIELLALGHMLDQQQEFSVHYRGRYIGRLSPDLIVDGKIVTDPQVVTTFNESHVAQMLGYLSITGRSPFAQFQRIKAPLEARG